MRSGVGWEAMISKRIFEALLDSFGATLSMASRRIMKKPLTGSLTCALSTSPASQVARRLPAARTPEKPASAVPDPI